MKLNALIEKTDASLLWGDLEQEISAVVYDSRKVTPGSLFVCMSGFAMDGHKFMADAVAKGAVALVVEEAHIFTAQEKDATKDITVVSTSNSRKTLAYLSASWFGNPAEQMTIIGITGTKGKTTTAHMMKRILEESGSKVGMIGTLGAFIGTEKYPTQNTTPESYELHSLFAKMVEAGCKYVVMEVSSQALKLHRTDGILFNYAVFLNLSPDHISEGEHADFEEYKSCKKMLFSQCECAVVNKDEDCWEYMTEHAPKVYTTSRESQADLMATDINNVWKKGFLGVSFQLSGTLAGDMAGLASLNMPGSFNVENALIAIAVANLLNISKEAIVQGLATVYVKGRTQLLTKAHFSTFVIDYAHNALSMESLLSMLRGYQPKRLICLFGGGGNKPKQRRYDMGEMAGKYADLTILTTDNPRFEEVEDINNDIIVGLNVHNGKYMTILDREEAIHYLLDNCGEDDIVALIGKGHEEYQDIKGVKYFFSEEKVVNDYLETK